MERILTTEHMRAADNYTIETLGGGEEILVERAGQALADEISSRFKGGRILFCVGKGNNGADGRVAAKILSTKHGFNVSVLSVYNGIFKLLEKSYDIIVDCIFGTGLNKPVEGKYKEVIEKINQSGAFIVSCDIPSGLNGDTGKVLGVAVKANLTISIQEYKLGQFLNDGLDYCGRIVCKDIGISVWGEDFIKRINDNDAKIYFSKRNRNTHKGSYKKACVLGGSKDYSGSIILSANALTALKMGVGYSCLAVPNSIWHAYVGKVPECVLTPFDDDIQGDLSDLYKFNKYDCIALGMGMGVTQRVYEIVSYLLTNYQGTLVLDADALNAIAVYGVDILLNKRCKVILTPHVAEFSRISKHEIKDVLNNPILKAKEFAKKYEVNLLLKNAVSVITDGYDVYLNTTGSSGLAKCGSGDVLSGIIAGLCARTSETLESLVVSAYIFGKAGEFVESEQNAYTMTASDVINVLPMVINKL